MKSESYIRAVNSLHSFLLCYDCTDKSNIKIFNDWLSVTDTKPENADDVKKFLDLIDEVKKIPLSGLAVSATELCRIKEYTGQT